MLKAKGVGSVLHKIFRAGRTEGVVKLFLSYRLEEVPFWHLSLLFLVGLTLMNIGMLLNLLNLNLFSKKENNNNWIKSQEKNYITTE